MLLKKLSLSFACVCALCFMSCAHSKTNEEPKKQNVVQVEPPSPPSVLVQGDENTGSIYRINYNSKDYQNGGIVNTQKSAYVYLPVGYDENDSSKKYPVLYLMHGVGGTESEWGLSKSNSVVKAIMDKRVADKSVEPFIIVTPNGRSNFNFFDISFSNHQAFYSFGQELRNDLIPYIEQTFNVSSDRNDRAMAGLSMGGMQTINIGLCESLDLISWFGAFSAAPTSYSSKKIDFMITTYFDEYPINYFYNICGLQDGVAYGSAAQAAKNITTVSKKFVEGENFQWYECDGGHDFNIWYKGFEDFAQIIFK